MNSPKLTTLEQVIFNTSLECPAWEIEDITEKLESKNLNTIELIKDYFERIHQYQTFIEKLLERLTEEKIIKMSKQKYYSLTNSNTKGCTGETMAYKYIFNKYIIDSFEYNALPEDKKNGFNTINNKQLVPSIIREIMKQLIKIEEEFENKYNIRFDEI
jgi:hypothetical protein